MRALFLLIASLAVTAPAMIVYETGFETNPDLPEGWTMESHGPGPDWAFGGNPEDWHMRVRFGEGGDQDEWLVSPALDLSTHQGISVQFWQWFRTFGNGVAQVRVSIDGGPWENVVEYGSDQFGEPVVPVPQAGGRSNVRFCWRYLASNDYQWDVDDVRVHAEVAVDLQVVGTRGPSPGDYLRQGADQAVRVTFKNLGGQPSPTATVRFTTAQGASQASLTSGIAPGDTLGVSFSVPGSLFSSTGEATLTIVVEASGDAVPANDTLTVSPLRVIDEFPTPATTILNYDDPADSARFAALLIARGEQYDCWNRKREGATDVNLYGLEAWRVVCFTETEIYPALDQQFALMRFLDQPAPGLRRGLLVSGDNWLRFSSTGAVVNDLVETYLGMGFGQEITTSMPSLYPVPDNALGFGQILSTNAEYPDVVTPNPAFPRAELVLAYDQSLAFGAMGTYRTATYQTVAAGFEWGQLIVQNEQAALAGACVDWMLAAKAERAVGEAFRLDVAPNPATDRLIIRMPEPVGDAPATANLVDMAGRHAASWRLTSSVTELKFPHAVSAGAYCLVVAPREGAQMAQRVVVWR